MGQLQHPGIAPVYELGQFADERPFFSMKLVKGQTLATLLAEAGLIYLQRRVSEMERPSLSIPRRKSKSTAIVPATSRLAAEFPLTTTSFSVAAPRSTVSVLKLSAGASSTVPEL